MKQCCWVSLMVHKEKEHGTHHQWVLSAAPCACVVLHPEKGWIWGCYFRQAVRGAQHHRATFLPPLWPLQAPEPC